MGEIIKLLRQQIDLCQRLLLAVERQRQALCDGSGDSMSKETKAIEVLLIELRRIEKRQELLLKGTATHDLAELLSRTAPSEERAVARRLLEETNGIMREMQEAVAIKQAVKPDQILMVVDAMTGQDIVNVVTTFAERVDFDGVIMSKLDGDARGGGALSVREVTGKPIKFVSMGEKPDSLEVFHPDRMAKRILGMGDVISIVEQAQKNADEKQVEDAERMLREGFTMDDLLAQMQQIRKMGGLAKLIGALPGGDRLMSQQGGLDDSSLGRIEAIIHSMTKEERMRPKIINGQRRRRISDGSGRTIQEMNKMMGKMRAMTQSGNAKKGRRQMEAMMRNMGFGGGQLPKF